MKYERLENPSSVDWTEVTAKIAAGYRVVAQFSNPVYSSALLSELNARAGALGDDFEIRFYAHYPSGFDASVLQHVRDARRLSIDCLTKASHLDMLAVLKDVRHLSLGVYEGNLGKILSLPALRGLESLSLGESKDCGIDLEPLSGFQRLRRLHVTGHATNLDFLASSGSITELSLSRMGKGVGLSFASRMPALTDLQLLLGGRESIEEIRNEKLRSLKVIRVKGLRSLGGIARFPVLRTFEIEDQIQLAGLSFSENACLETLRIVNCKTFSSLTGLSALTALKHLRIGRTAISFDEFITTALPTSLECLAFYTGKNKRDAEIKRLLEARGYSEWWPRKPQ